MSAEARRRPLLRVEHLVKHFPLRRGLFGAHERQRCTRSTA